MFRPTLRLQVLYLELRETGVTVVIQEVIQKGRQVCTGARRYLGVVGKTLRTFLHSGHGQLQ